MNISLELSQYNNSFIQALIYILQDSIESEPDELIKEVFNTSVFSVVKELSTENWLLRIECKMRNARHRGEIAVTQEEFEELRYKKIDTRLKALCKATKRNISKRLEELQDIDWRPEETIPEDYYAG